MSKKLEASVVKRRYAIHKLQKKYGNKLSIADVRTYLKTEYSIVVSWHTVERDFTWMKNNDINEHLFDKKQTKLQLEFDELSIQLKNAKEVEIKAREQGKLTIQNTAIKTQKDIVAIRRLVSRDMDALEMQSKTIQNDVYTIVIGMQKQVKEKEIIKK